MPYYRPIPRTDPARPAGALTLAGGWCWFDTVEVLDRAALSYLMPAADLPIEALHRLTTPRAPVAGLDMTAPQIMGILNVTPDSFSDGGQHFDPEVALAHARQMASDGAAILDVGGESTRPGAAPVPVEDEITRTAPIISALRAGLTTPISIDTRKAAVAQAAHAVGANLINDVAGLTYDPALAPYAATHALPVCVMHAQGSPETMQQDPRYDHVLLDVYDWLAARIEALEALGIPRARIITDPGIGFGKTVAHNLTLLQNLSLFHSLGCPVLLGASRKRFIGEISRTPVAADRIPGSLAVALGGVAQGVQILRVHDVPETRAALDLWRATLAAPRA
ncbi:Dihydropteroate synthase, DHPS [Roseovarius sp. TM1035]|jgi:dihydropteroate synthase|uniref:dihydropteroate synthase n=1 Tax=Roseovarius sp. TM1035 TaxID=391613 RepID=UPI0001557442|nr:dihydropteroate synthase [Roseovarius sp. TM1035]AWZ20975.1 Dihydropteroate synthase [Roseovarius sp. AK1035]EDM32852.1 Dihydropteroate synthase, DHPS [Roseovarius sp. TM1035]